MSTENKKGARLLEQPDTEKRVALEKTTNKIISRQRAKRKWRRRVLHAIDGAAGVTVGFAVFIALGAAANGGFGCTMLACGALLGAVWLEWRMEETRR